MEDKKIGLSLKYKLLLLLTLIPVVALAAYLLMAIREFEKDKMPYVWESSAAMAKSLAEQMGVEVNGFLENVRLIVVGFDPVERQFSPASVEVFSRAKRIDALVLYQRDANGQYAKIGELANEEGTARNFINDRAVFEKVRDVTITRGQSLAYYERSDIHFVISTLIGDPQSATHTVLIGLYRSPDLVSAFSESMRYRNFLVSRKGAVELGPKEVAIEPELLQPVLADQKPVGSVEIGADRPQIAGYAEVPSGDFVVVSLVDKKEALMAVQILIVKSIITFFGLIAATTLISALASVRLTKTLRDLYAATKKVAKGEFDVRVEAKSNDEVGGLAEGFNFMAGEINRLIEQTKESARMETELETVKLVQETLFPQTQTKVGPYSIIGHFEPASECGGDWWNYSLVGDKLYLWIGDATGHGAPAAMVTSAAKSAATIIESLPFISPGKAMEILNKAIHETTKGRILMTFFIAALDLKTGEIVYANASHEPPYIIRNSSGKITKKNLEPLVDASGPRLGDNKTCQYEEARAELSPGDAVLFYTDGITDLKNVEGKAWGERGFIKSICDSASAGPTLEERISRLKNNISSYRQDTALVDDITLFMCQYDREAA